MPYFFLEQLNPDERRHGRDRLAVELLEGVDRVVGVQQQGLVIVLEHRAHDEQRQTAARRHDHIGARVHPEFGITADDLRFDVGAGTARKQFYVQTASR